MENQPVTPTPAAQPVQPKNKKKAVLLTILALILIGGLVGGTYAWQQSKVKDTQAQLDEANSKIEQLSKQEESEVTQETTPTETRVTLGNLSFVAPANWQNIKKATPQNSALQTYSFEAGSNVTSSGVQMTNEKISLFNLADVNLDFGGTTMQVYNEATKTWQTVNKQPLKNFNKIVAHYVGDGNSGNYSLTADYYLVKGSQVIAVTAQEVGRDNNMYSFPSAFSSSSASSKSNAFQEEVVSLLNSVK